MKQNNKAVSLTLNLFAPGMSPIHRAGLGGLAMTLRYIEDAFARGTIDEKDLPGEPWKMGKPPWRIEVSSIELQWNKPENAKTFLKRLFVLAFQTKNGLIFLPGQYKSEPNQAVLADLQNGLTLTFLQHGKTRNLATPTVVQHDPEGTGLAVTVEFRKCDWYKHQDGWEDLIDRDGCLGVKTIEVIGPLNPGAVVRHVAFSADTKIEDTPDRLLPLYFALIGCLALPVNRGVAVLIVPDVDDLEAFAEARPWMTPTSAKECLISSAADGVLQAQVRLRNHKLTRTHELPGCHAMTFQPTPWARQQKSRVATTLIPPGDEKRLERFEFALAELPPKIVTIQNKSNKAGKKTSEKAETQSIRVDSVVRPLVAANLAQGRPWYAGFHRLMIAQDSSGNPIRNKLSFERKGLNAMVENAKLVDQPGETTVVRAVHEAMRNRYGAIADENKGSPVAMKKRFESEYDRWRIAFAGAKTANHLRSSLCDLFSRGGNNKVLRDAWRDVLPMLGERHWQLTRDLALLALASYASQVEPKTPANPNP